MKAWLYCGAKVVCIDNSVPGHINPGEIIPECGPVYTVREVLIHRGYAQIRLVEIVNPVQEFTDGFLETTYGAHRFAPVSTIDTTAAVAKLARLTIPAGRKVMV